MNAKEWPTSAPSDQDQYRIAVEFLGECGLNALPYLFSRLGSDSSYWLPVEGQVVLAEILNLLIDALDLGDPNPVFTLMMDCPPELAQRGHDLLLGALCSDLSQIDPTQIDDAAVLCLGLLLGLAGEKDAVTQFLRDSSTGRTSLYFYDVATKIVDRFASGTDRDSFKPKLIIWDLDDTLWQGTLAEGDEPVLHQRRVDYVRTFNARGIVSAICSKNDFATARAQLEAFGLWDEFVFPRIAFVPKGPAVRQLIGDMQLRPTNVLFIDDNPHNRHEVAEAVPGIRVIDATSPDCDLMLQAIASSHAAIEKSRVAEYRMLEEKVAERRESQLSDQDFLIQSKIRATTVFRMDNLDFTDRIEELINRSNQLNYLESRVAPGAVERYIVDISRYHVLSVFAWDKHGYYGLVGVAIYDFCLNAMEHFAFSCRIMHMGIEAFVVEALREYRVEVDPVQLLKPLPAQSAIAITATPFEDPEVRKEIFAKEAPRDWLAVRLRVMADCQSGAFYHYSRFRDEIDYDNRPRLFTLPMMHTGEFETQHFPDYLVYAAATDYATWRWEERTPLGMDVDLVRDCMERFVEMVARSGRKCLLLLPLETGPIELFNLHRNCDPALLQRLHPVFNDQWRKLAGRHPDHFSIIELGEVLSRSDLHPHAHHYVPSALKRITGMIDSWYETVTEDRNLEPLAEAIAS